jgi:poly(A) polymerase
VTNARPEEIKRVFGRKCRIIGRRFRLVHVYFGRNHFVEVATFRGNVGEGQRKTDATGRILCDNVYGTMDEDVWRRDFTVNSLYYDIKDFSIIDYAGGLQDLQTGVLRLIGDPETRYREDPVRTIRAVRFAVKLGFKIDPATEAPLMSMGALLQEVSPARLFEEVLKLFHNKQAVEVFEKLRQYNLFKYLFPQVDAMLDSDPLTRGMVLAGLHSTETRLQQGKGVNPAFLFAFMLWGPLVKQMKHYLAEDLPPMQALAAAADDVISMQIRATAVPKRFTQQVREIWHLQLRLDNRYGDRAAKLVEHQRFRAAYDLLGLRVEAGEEELKPLFEWWTEYQSLSLVDRVAFALQVARPKRKRKRRRRNRNPYRRRAQFERDEPSNG